MRNSIEGFDPDYIVGTTYNGIIIYKMESKVNLFDDDSPIPRKKEAIDKRPTDFGTKDNKTGSSRRNRKRTHEGKSSTLNEVLPSLVAANHKVKFKNEVFEEDLVADIR